MGQRPPSLSVIIPAYNEAGRLPTTLDRLAACHTHAPSWRSLEVIIVCDGCSDATAEVARHWQPPGVAVRVVDYRPNRGKGFAIRQGMAVSTGDVVAFMDADGATSPAELGRLLAVMAEVASDIVIGSRRTPDARIGTPQSLPRRAAGKIFHLVVRLLFGLPFRDTQCGFKLFRGTVGRELFSQCRENGFIIDVEMLARARQQGFSVVETGVNWCDVAASSIALRHDAWDMFTCALGLWLHGRRGRTATAIGPGSPDFGGHFRAGPGGRG